MALLKSTAVDVFSLQSLSTGETAIERTIDFQHILKYIVIYQLEMIIM